jgi:hypothetical protein
MCSFDSDIPGLGKELMKLRKSAPLTVLDCKLLKTLASISGKTPPTYVSSKFYQPLLHPTVTSCKCALTGAENLMCETKE